ncbi:hypothetical protein A2526_05865 [candidate division WOR-1 bacterium RIFOXYD2_FULL_36_8]|uniref:PepSY domain-containing protein n=1 Tax=candidate division WOR-1 bacterium RIFOXYB2_FULL_36_35 TaxID=1802578 RepID=A0A1F4RYT0_UNCSA|nr:MAG: hypothetical protein A2230_08795 [candidate division WOR-1 bacterium RIFOXYA2_FULL_36_21]OGC13307.1 MAG: hypothetical protein A2290_08240 [candidate division WOR-1 bacterium RIFOXYB2_FULL_36_35]OGC16786.1 MAG: hypothetical protein A2282_04820 [candidate division WOR-1 bacterium RIFOXYA12_FULL_36_13]OGC37459.1 MAG: hypothetical protein A2526_05865 [candidate division WOR-1 bacterium RIFOXYD2_FULL_36_8]
MLMLNKPLFLSVPTILLLLPFALVLLTAFMFNPFKKSPEYEIVEVRDFSWPSFTFKYPVFKKWENISLDQEGCELMIKDNKNYTFITIRVRIEKSVLFTLFSSKKNKQGIPYILDSKNQELRFMLGDKPGRGEIIIKIFKLPIKNQDIHGFSNDQFFKTIIESFKLVNNIQEELAISIARQDAEKIYKDLSIYNIATSLEADGWHVDYELKSLEMIMMGGGPHYIIDSKTGKIISKRYEQ